ncbi:MAG: hypothetical protein IT293_14300 [Deltaproteobacteria bacterium]|nr:hypothetical protein [Deltaproteobacteria bacterium]
MAEPAPRKPPLERTEARCAAAVYVTLAVAIALVALAVRGAWVPWATLLLLPIFVAALADATRTTTTVWRDWRAYELGVNVKRALAALRPAYRVVTRGPTLVERDRHVAIGPNGVFLILSSDDGGRVTASDQRLFVNARLPWRNLVEDCRVEALRVADRAQRALGRPVPVHAVLCFTRALVAVGQEIRGVKIVQVPRLARLIESVATPTSLSEQDVEAVRAALAATAPAAPARKIFRLTPRPAATRNERPSTLVGRPSRPHHSLS